MLVCVENCCVWYNGKRFTPESGVVNIDDNEAERLIATGFCKKAEQQKPVHAEAPKRRGRPSKD